MGRGRGATTTGAGSSLRRRGATSSPLLPQTAEAKEYYKGVIAKHFGKETTGSRFIEDGIGLEEIVSRLPEIDPDKPLKDQDNRGDFLSRGAGGLKDDLGYFTVPAKGILGLIPAESLSPDETVSVEKIKGNFLSFTVDKKSEETTSEATVIIGKDEEEKPFLITTFPGIPYDPNASGINEESGNGIGLFDGQKITLGDLQNLLDTKDLLLQASST